MAKESDLLLAKNSKNMTKKNSNKTITLNAQMVISQSENGVDHIQVLPDDPCEGLVKPFSGKGHAQLQGDATFDFIRRKKKRYKPVLKLLHSSISYGQDGLDRYMFFLPNEQREEFAKLLMKEVKQAIAFMNKGGNR